MNFLAPLFLLGALAVALPVIFHLIRRATRERRVFSSLMFLQTSPPRLSRRSRLEHIVLLLLRCAVVCLLALAFARPFFRKAGAGSSPPSVARRLVVLVDTSASMRRAGLWPKARSQAEFALRQTSPADQAALLTFDRESHRLMSFDQWNAANPGERAALAAARLAATGSAGIPAGTAPGWSGTYLGRALIEAAETLAEPSGGPAKSGRPAANRPSAGPGHIMLISDLQEGSHLEPLQGYEWPKNVTVSVVALKPNPGNNASLQLVTESDDGSSPAPAAVRVRVSNAPDSRREQFKVGWVLPEGRDFAGAPLDVYVPPGQSRIVPVPLPDAGLASRPVGAVERIRLEGDDEDFDNTVFVVPPEAEKLSVLYCGADSEKDPAQPLYFLRRAFQESRRQAVQVIVRRPGKGAGRDAGAPSGGAGGPGEAAAPLLSAADLASATLLVVTDPLPEAMAAAMREQVTAGKTLLVVLKSGAEARSLAGLLGVERVGLTEAAPRNYAILGEIDFRHPLFAPFADPRFSDFTKIHFWKYRQIETATLPGARVLARFDSGDPALIEVPVGKGRVVLLASSWHPADSQLALSTKFVPLLYALLEHSGAPLPLPVQYHVGDVIPLASTDAGERAAAAILTPDGARLDLAAGVTSFSQTLTPGVYTLASTRPPRRFAVNLETAESRTMPLSVEELERLGVPLARPESAVAREAQRKVRLQDVEFEDRQRLWRWCLLAALAVLLFETWLAGRTGARPDDDGSVAQVSKPAVSPTSKSAGRPNVQLLRVWKPAIEQTWKSALRIMRRTGVG